MTSDALFYYCSNLLPYWWHHVPSPLFSLPLLLRPAEYTSYFAL